MVTTFQVLSNHIWLEVTSLDRAEGLISTIMEQLSQSSKPNHKREGTYDLPIPTSYTSNQNMIKLCCISVISESKRLLGATNTHLHYPGELFRGRDFEVSVS